MQLKDFEERASGVLSLLAQQQTKLDIIRSAVCSRPPETGVVGGVEPACQIATTLEDKMREFFDDAMRQIVRTDAEIDALFESVVQTDYKQKSTGSDMFASMIPGAGQVPSHPRGPMQADTSGDRECTQASQARQAGWPTPG